MTAGPIVPPRTFACWTYHRPTSLRAPIRIRPPKRIKSYKVSRAVDSVEIANPRPSGKRPWIIDIFLYPANRAGITVLLICTGIPFFLRVFVKFCFGLMVHVPVLVILWAISIVVHWGMLSLLVLYVNWYLWECIRDSAAGGHTRSRNRRDNSRARRKSSETLSKGLAVWPSAWCRP